MYNRVVLIGRIGKDTEPRFMPDGQNGVVNFSLATNRKWRDKDGNWQDATQWHNIVYWSKNIKPISERLKKGRLVMVEGEIRYSQWEDKDGGTHYKTEIAASRVMSLEKRDKDTTAAAEPTAEETTENFPAEGNPTAAAGETEDDLPF